MVPIASARIATRKDLVLNTHQLAAWLDRKFLDEQIAGSLRAIVAQEDEARRLEQLREVQARRRQERHEEIQRLAQQLGVLAQQGPEGHLRIRYAEQMEAAQRAVGDAEDQVRQLEQGAEAARAEALVLLRALVTASGGFGTRGGAAAS